MSINSLCLCYFLSIERITVFSGVDQKKKEKKKRTERSWPFLTFERAAKWRPSRPVGQRLWRQKFATSAVEFKKYEKERERERETKRTAPAVAIVNSVPATLYRLATLFFFGYFFRVGFGIHRVPPSFTGFYRV